ncbi:MAG: biosynthetic-type acetolactate synthase large subunit [Atribacterota bacterium]|nr:biosynthetic-type acetolactate synthase large subunit [Atribacterota bacterium]MDI9593653.1 biosynthetic-type acetolactate synthase large subunit [Atribacterota bacterium]HHT10508.1 biosynthetic-type acetolactate synthase large subunit [Candidatus Atribacteria bacterium]
MKMKGAQILIELLKKEGVTTVFGYPGGQVIDIYDALYEFSDIKHILVRHEQGAVHAADGYARTTGKVGVCMATSGPGATNLVTGLANAYMDSIPIVAITGQVPTRLIGKDAFQEADTTGITMPITKHNFLIKSIHDLPLIIREAFLIASTGRPGPVLIDIPKDVQIAEIDFNYPEKLEIPGYKPTYRGHFNQINMTAQAIKEATRPLFYVGGGVIASGASDILLEVVEKTDIPVTYTLMAKGAIPEDHRLSLGWLGMHGSYHANKAIMNCDLLIAVGARFDDRVTGNTTTFANRAKIVHIDIDPAEIGKNVKINIPIVGDARNVLNELNKRTEPKKHDEWLETIEKWKKEYTPKPPANNELVAQTIIESVYQATQGDAILVTDVGQHQMWAAKHFLCHRPRRWASSGGLGTMGFGLPAAIGAQIGNPDQTVILFSGDGSIMMKIQELVTAVNNCLPLKIFVLNNNYLGMVRQWQECFFDCRYSSTHIINPDLANLAQAFGAEGIPVQNQEELDRAVPRVLEVKDHPVLVDCRISKETNVYPFVPPGKSLDEMILE